MNFLIRHLFLTLFVLFIPQALWAQASTIGGILINAEKMDRDGAKKIVKLEGNVQLVFQGNHLSCDKATVYFSKNTIEAQGNVILKNDHVHAEGSRLVLNYEKNLGTFYDGFIQSGQVVFEGKIVEKTGPETYVASDAKYTTCITCPPAWSFTGRNITAEMGGYAKIERPVLRLGGVPILILPGIIVPLKSSRQSGFLVPSMDYSSTGGLAISESFFWAISRSKDLTFTEKFYQFRGLKSLGEYRYVVTENSRGNFKGAFINDDAFELGGEPFPMKRWFLEYDHSYLLPEDIVNRVHLTHLSDLRYTKDFPDELLGHGDPALENRLTVTKNTESQHLSADTMYYINLLQENPLEGNENAVHRLPQIKYSLTERRVLGLKLLFRSDLEYVNFARRGFSYDDINDTTLGDPACPLTPSGSPTSKCIKRARDGEFNPDRDIIRTGQRLDFRPSLSYPIQVGPYFTLQPDLHYRETQYRFPLSDSLVADGNYAPTAARRYVETNLAMKTRFSRVFGDLNTEKAIRLKHEIEPEVTYSHIPWARRPEHAFFGQFEGQEFSKSLEPVSDEDAFGRNRLQFDYNDRLFDKRLIDLGVTNRLIRKYWTAGSPDYKTIASLRLSQSYDLNEAKTEKPQPWSTINSLLDVRLTGFETNTLAVHYPYAKVTNTNSRLKFISDSGDFVQLSYTRSFLVNDENTVVDNSETENIGFALGFVSKYFNITGKVDYSNITNEIRSWDYLAVLNPPGNCWSINLMHQQILGGDRQIKINFNFKFDGETPSSTSRL